MCGTLCADVYRYNMMMLQCRVWTLCVCVCVLRMQWQFVVTHTILQTEISALLDSRVTITPAVKMLCPHKNVLSFYLNKNVTCWGVGLLMFAEGFNVSFRFVCWWVLIYCCFMSSICSSHSVECEHYTA